MRVATDLQFVKQTNKTTATATTTTTVLQSAIKRGLTVVVDGVWNKVTCIENLASQVPSVLLHHLFDLSIEKNQEKCLVF